MSKTRKRLKIGITIGDYNGIGPELIIKAFQDQRLKELCTPVVYGSPKVLNIYRKMLEVDKFSYNVVQEPGQAHPRKISVIDCIRNTDRIEAGIPSPAAGLGAFEALDRAVQDLKAKEIDALITLPIDKSTIQNDEFEFPGHTEYLANAFGQSDSLMFMVSDRLKVGVVTGHVPLRLVADVITSQLVYTKLKILDQSLKVDFGIDKPKIAVLGLNPHAGDHGLLGTEEEEHILPAIKKAESEKIFALGPFSADGFFGMGHYARFDAVLAMYHDQGLMPFKLMAGFEGVNFTAGLPMVRTSPDHGIAYEIAGKNLADPTSFIHAIYKAIDIHKDREANLELFAGALKPIDPEKKPKELDRDESVMEEATEA